MNKNSQMADKADERTDYLNLKMAFDVFKILLLSILLVKLFYSVLDLCFLANINIFIKDEIIIKILEMLPFALIIWTLFIVEAIAKILRKYKRAKIAPALWAIGCVVPLFNIFICILIWKRSDNLLKELKRSA